MSYYKEAKIRTCNYAVITGNCNYGVITADICRDSEDTQELAQGKAGPSALVTARALSNNKQTGTGIRPGSVSVGAGMCKEPVDLYMQVPVLLRDV